MKLYLCGQCEQSYRAGYEVKERERDIRRKRKCVDCGRMCFGAEYEITVRRSEK